MFLAILLFVNVIQCFWGDKKALWTFFYKLVGKTLENLTNHSVNAEAVLMIIS